MSRLCKWALVLVVVAFMAGQFGCASKEVLGNKSSKIYHACDAKCVERMQPANKVPFACEDDACKEGYRACKACFRKETGGKKDPGPKKAK